MVKYGFPPHSMQIFYSSNLHMLNSNTPLVNSLNCISSLCIFSFFLFGFPFHNPSSPSFYLAVSSFILPTLVEKHEPLTLHSPFKKNQSWSHYKLH